jgi:N4-gp56 family major capsid protein
MPFQWEADFSAGVMRNHALSAKIREASIADALFMRFVSPEPGYGRGRGDSITITTIKNLTEPTNATIREGERVPIDRLQQGTVTITVEEMGRGVEFDQKVALLAHYDPADKIQKALRRQLKLVMDTAAAAAFKASELVAIPTSLTGITWDTNGVPVSTPGLQNMTVNHVKVIRDYMSDTIHIPGRGNGERYACIISTKAARGLKNDPEFLAWRSQIPETNRSAFENSKIGTIENIDFFESNHTAALSNSEGTSSVVGEAVFFGDDAVAMAVAQDPELRAAAAADFGRARAVAWYGILAFGLTNDTANDGEAKVVYFTG